MDLGGEDADMQTVSCQNGMDLGGEDADMQTVSCQNGMDLGGEDADSKLSKWDGLWRWGRRQ